MFLNLLNSFKALAKPFISQKGDILWASQKKLFIIQSI